MKRQRGCSPTKKDKSHESSPSMSVKGADIFSFGDSKPWVVILIILIVTMLAYQPVWHAGFMWDDDQDVTGNRALHSWDGLRQIWLNPGATSQYYPLTFTAFWLEYHLWGLHPLGYHLVNVLLHICNAILAGIILKRLRVPGAWLAAGIFALHPVCVESVVWVTEHKNTISGTFYFVSLLMAIQFWFPKESSTSSLCAGKSSNLSSGWKFYWLALAAYVFALCGKTSVAPLPVVIVLFVWWKLGKVAIRDALLIGPFLVIGLTMGLITIYVENHVGATAGGGDLSWLQRFFIAGKDLWFYLGKLLWPQVLIYVYPKWETPTSWAMASMPLLGWGIGLIILWFKRQRWGRGPFVAVAYFIILLALVLGFFNISFFHYSFVSDHFQYLACLGPIALAASAITFALDSWGRQNQFLKSTGGGALLVGLGILTWQHVGECTDNETLWQTTIAKNPDCWMAYNNLGKVLLEKGQPSKALEYLQVAAKLKSDEAGIQNDLGSAWLQNGNPSAAFRCFQKALTIQPDFAMAYNNLGDFFLKEGRPIEAFSYLQKAITIQPNLAEANYNLGNVFLEQGDEDAAIRQWKKTLDIQPNFSEAWNNLGNAILARGQIDIAIEYFQKAVALKPDFAEADNNLGTAYIQSGEADKAILWLKVALKYQPDYVAAMNNLAWILATCPNAQLREGNEAVKLAWRANQISGGNSPVVLRTLAAAYADTGQFTKAISMASLALQFIPSRDSLAENLKGQIQLYQVGKPIRDASPIKTR